VFDYDNGQQGQNLIKCNLIPLDNMFKGINSAHNFLLLKYNVATNLYDTFGYLYFGCGKICGTITEANAIEVYGYGYNKKTMKIGDPFWYYEFDKKKNILVDQHGGRQGEFCRT